MIERDDEGGSAKLKVMGKEQDKEEEEEKKVLKGEQLCISWIGCCQRLLRPFYFVAFCSPGRLVYSVHSTHTHTHAHAQDHSRNTHWYTSDCTQTDGCSAASERCLVMKQFICKDSLSN